LPCLAACISSFLQPQVTPFFQGGTPTQLLLSVGRSAARVPPFLEPSPELELRRAAKPGAGLCAAPLPAMALSGLKPCLLLLLQLLLPPPVSSASDKPRGSNPVNPGENTGGPSGCGADVSASLAGEGSETPGEVRPLPGPAGSWDPITVTSLPIRHPELSFPAYPSVWTPNSWMSLPPGSLTWG
jgi:hypothetical protein